VITAAAAPASPWQQVLDVLQQVLDQQIRLSEDMHALRVEVRALRQTHPARKVTAGDVAFLMAIDAAVGQVAVTSHDLCARASKDTAFACAAGGAAVTPTAIGRRLGRLHRAGDVAGFRVFKVSREGVGQLWSVERIMSL